MSCWETSTFLPDLEFTETALLKEACDRLGWCAEERNNVLTIWDVGQKNSLRGEYALRIQGNKVRYNTYYMRTGKEKIAALEASYRELYLPFLANKIKETFRQKGYSIRVNERFTASEEQYASFFAVATSKLPEEQGVEAKIKFTIFSKGTFESDSNYIPPDIHELADEAMDALEKDLNAQRAIKPKPRHLIPQHQRNQAHCKAKPKNTIKRKN